MVMYSQHWQQLQPAVVSSWHNCSNNYKKAAEAAFFMTAINIKSESKILGETKCQSESIVAQATITLV